MKETLQNFLTTGSLSFFEFGTKRQHIVMLLGATSNVIQKARKGPRSAVLKYDQVEFYFDESDELNGVMIQLISEPVESHKLEFDYAWMSKRITQQEVSNELDKLKLNYKTEKKFDSTQLTTETGITFYFDGTLQKVGKFMNQ